MTQRCQWIPHIAPTPWSSSYVLAVLLPGEVSQLCIVLLLVLQGTAVLAWAQLTWVNAVGLQEALIGHAKCLPDGLGDDLGLGNDRGCSCLWLRPGTNSSQCPAVPSTGIVLGSSRVFWLLPCMNRPLYGANSPLHFT